MNKEGEKNKEYRMMNNKLRSAGIENMKAFKLLLPYSMIKY